jgi:hypothetical protein
VLVTCSDSNIPRGVCLLLRLRESALCLFFMTRCTTTRDEEIEQKYFSSDGQPLPTHLALREQHSGDGYNISSRNRQQRMGEGGIRYLYK